MQLTVHLDTDNAEDKAALLRLVGASVDIGTLVATVEPVENESEEAPAPKPRARRTTKPKAPEPEPEVETPAEDDDEDLLGDDDGPSFEERMRDAKSRASVLVAAKNGNAVKDALLAAGAKRVTELTEANLDAFLSALPAE